MIRMFLTSFNRLAVDIHNLPYLKAHQDEAVMLRSAKVTQRPKFNHWVMDDFECSR